MIATKWIKDYGERIYPVTHAQATLRGEDSTVDEDLTAIESDISDLNDKFDDYVTSENLTTQLNNYVTSESLTTQLNDYVTSANLTTQLNDYVTETSLQDDYLINYIQNDEISDWAKAENKPTYTSSEVGAISTDLLGVASGVATLDSNGKVYSNQLPSYVDDVLEYATLNDFPSENPETGKIYVSLDTNKTYRWSGSAYVEISAGVTLGTTHATAYYGDLGQTAYNHSQLTSGNPHNVTKTDIGLSNVGNYKSVSVAASQGLTDLEKLNARTNIGAGTSSFSGSYNDLTNKPTIGNGTVTITQNGVNKGSFTLNQSGTTTIGLSGNTISSVNGNTIVEKTDGLYVAQLSNIDTVSKLSEDSSGNLLFDGKKIEGDSSGGGSSGGGGDCTALTTQEEQYVINELSQVIGNEDGEVIDINAAINQDKLWEDM